MDHNELGSSLLTTEEAAAYITMTPRYLEALRYRGGGPTYLRLSSRAVRYRLADLDAWLRGRAFSSTAEEAGADAQSSDAARS